jgi:hypothetical protein
MRQCILKFDNLNCTVEDWHISMPNVTYISQIKHQASPLNIECITYLTVVLFMTSLVIK